MARSQEHVNARSEIYRQMLRGTSLGYSAQRYSFCSQQGTQTTAANTPKDIPSMRLVLIPAEEREGPQTLNPRTWTPNPRP